MAVKEVGNITSEPQVDSITVGGTISITSELASGPSAPADGDGGVLYIKNDGKLYFISQDVAETDLTAGGGGGLSISSITTGTSSTVTDYDTMYIINTAAAYEITLPTAGSQEGKTIDVLGQQAGSFAVTVTTNGSETINGSSVSYLLTSNYANLTLVSDGTNWVIR